MFLFSKDLKIVTDEASFISVGRLFQARIVQEKKMNPERD